MYQAHDSYFRVFGSPATERSSRSRIKRVDDYIDGRYQRRNSILVCSRVSLCSIRFERQLCGTPRSNLDRLIAPLFVLKNAAGSNQCFVSGTL